MAFTNNDPGQNDSGAGNEPPIEGGFVPDPSNSGTVENNQPGMGGGETQPNPESLANPYLQKIPEQDRAIVAKYIKDWDAGVTRRFQEIHDQYRPYKELGAQPEDLQAAINIYQQLNSDPRAFYTALAEALGEELEQANQTRQQPNANPAYEGLPPEFQAEFQQTRKAVEALAQYILDQQQQTQQQREDQELDNYLKQLRETHGDFDEEFVLTKMYTQNMNGEQAIQAWKTAMQEYVNKVGGVQQNQNGLKVLSGGGSVPNEESKKVTDLSKNETKALVADIMRQSVES